MKPMAAPPHAVLELSGERVRRLVAGDLAGLAGRTDLSAFDGSATGQNRADGFFKQTLHVLDIDTRIVCFAQCSDMRCVGLFQRVHAQLQTEPLRELSTYSYVSEALWRCCDDWRLPALSVHGCQQGSRAALIQRKGCAFAAEPRRARRAGHRLPDLAAARKAGVLRTGGSTRTGAAILWRRISGIGRGISKAAMAGRLRANPRATPGVERPFALRPHAGFRIGLHPQQLG